MWFRPTPHTKSPSPSSAAWNRKLSGVKIDLESNRFVCRINALSLLSFAPTLEDLLEFSFFPGSKSPPKYVFRTVVQCGIKGNNPHALPVSDVIREEVGKLST